MLNVVRYLLGYTVKVLYLVWTFNFLQISMDLIWRLVEIHLLSLYKCTFSDVLVITVIILVSIYIYLRLVYVQKIQNNEANIKLVTLC